MRRRSSRAEDTIQRAVFAHLRMRAVPGVFAFHVPNGGKRPPVEAAMLNGLGVIAGVPDVVVIKGGRCFALELKSDTGRVSPSQELTIARLQDAGATVAVTRGLDAAIRQIEAWGLVRGTAIAQQQFELGSRLAMEATDGSGEHEIRNPRQPAAGTSRRTDQWLGKT